MSNPNAPSDDFDFSHLTPTKTAECVLTGVHWPQNNPLPIVLIGKHAGRSNARFTNAMLKRSDFKAAQTAVALDAANHRDIKLFIDTVITGWKNVLGADGGPLPYDAEKCRNLLAKLVEAKRPEIVSLAFAYFGDADHFVDEPLAGAGDLGNG